MSEKITSITPVYVVQFDDKTSAMIQFDKLDDLLEYFEIA